MLVSCASTFSVLYSDLDVSHLNTRDSMTSICQTDLAERSCSTPSARGDATEEDATKISVASKARRNNGFSQHGQQPKLNQKEAHMILFLNPTRKKRQVPFQNAKGLQPSSLGATGGRRLLAPWATGATLLPQNISIETICSCQWAAGAACSCLPLSACSSRNWNTNTPGSARRRVARTSGAPIQFR